MGQGVARGLVLVNHNAINSKQELHPESGEEVVSTIYVPTCYDAKLATGECNMKPYVVLYLTLTIMPTTHGY